MKHDTKATHTSIPEVLYHYTTAAGALGILSQCSVRGTMIHYMNDAQEFRYALGLAEQLILESKGAKGRAHVICGEFFAAIRRIAVYVFSLTENRDQLSQWRAYANDGGYAIGIESRLLLKVCESDQASLARCEYDVDAQRRLLRPILRDMLSSASSLDPDSRGIDLYDSFASRFTPIAATIKHPSFAEEREWRVISRLGLDRNRVQYRTAGGLIIPYWEWSLRQPNLYPISTVIVGPTVPTDLASRSLHHLTVRSLGWPVKVESSDSPLRPLR